jgi:MFS transporter, VNT family, synaptic vesicle glycoprotein 2
MIGQRSRRSTSMNRPLSEMPRSLDEYLESAASAPPSPWSLCVHRRKRRNPPLRSSIFLRYSNGGVESNASAAAVSFDGVATTTSNPEHSNNSSIWSQYPWRYWLMYFCLGVANSSDASEILCLSYILSVDQFETNILQHTAWRGGLLAATVFMGMLLGGLIVGAAGDGALGRQPLLVMGLAVNSLAGLASAAATNVFVLSGCRFIAGLGIGATVPPLFSLCSELAPPSSRGFWVTYVASFWMVGSIYVAVVGWTIMGQAEINTVGNDSFGWWRLFVAACAVPSCLGCILVHALVPESPRFLLLQGCHDEALSVAHRLAKHLRYTGPLLTRDELVYHYPAEEGGGHRTASADVVDGVFRDVSEGSESEGNRRESSVVRPFSMEGADGAAMMESNVEYQRRNSRMLQRASVTISTSHNALWSAMLDFSTSTSKLYTQQMRSTTWPLQMVWFSLSFGSYGLMTWINTLFVQVHLENVYFNALLFAASNLPGNILAALLMDKVGRASLLTGSILAASLSLVAFAYVAAHQASDSGTSDGDNSTFHATTISASWIVFAACSFQCFTIASWAAIDVLTSELFPTSIRSTGMGVCTATGRVGAMMAQFVNGALISSPVRLLLTAAGALFIGAVTPVFLPADQSGRPVQDYTTDSIEANHIRLSRIMATSPGNDDRNIEKLERSNGLDQEVEVSSVSRNVFLPHRGQEYTRVPLSGGRAAVTLSV